MIRSAKIGDSEVLTRISFESKGVVIKRGFWLDHMFIDPQYIGVGILADPNTRGFYKKMGCKYIREYPSTIKGRTTPLLEYTP